MSAKMKKADIPRLAELLGVTPQAVRQYDEKKLELMIAGMKLLHSDSIELSKYITCDTVSDRLIISLDKTEFNILLDKRNNEIRIDKYSEPMECLVIKTSSANSCFIK